MDCFPTLNHCSTSNDWIPVIDIFLARVLGAERVD
jgi:hypothetical protein